MKKRQTQRSFPHAVFLSRARILPEPPSLTLQYAHSPQTKWHSWRMKIDGFSEYGCAGHDSAQKHSRGAALHQNADVVAVDVAALISAHDASFYNDLMAG